MDFPFGVAMLIKRLSGFIFLERVRMGYHKPVCQHVGVFVADRIFEQQEIGRKNQQNQIPGIFSD